MAKPITPQPVVLNPATMKVETSSDYLQRGWLYLSSQQLVQAEQDFRHILETEAENIEGYYGLGLTLKAAGKKEAAIDAFERILGLLPKIQDSQRSSVLSRLVKGQINLMKTGDWNLEKEVWKRKN